MMLMLGLETVSGTQQPVQNVDPDLNLIQRLYGICMVYGVVRYGMYLMVFQLISVCVCGVPLVWTEGSCLLSSAVALCYVFSAFCFSSNSTYPRSQLELKTLHEKKSNIL